VPEILPAVRALEPLRRLERTLAPGQIDRDAIERARYALAHVPRERLAKRAGQLDPSLRPSRTAT
jgi:hypothetical protein